MKKDGGKAAAALRKRIKRALAAFADGKLADNAANLLKTLGYESRRTIHRDDNSPDAFLNNFDTRGSIDREKARLDEWQTADFLFQLTAHELNLPVTDPNPAAANGLDDSLYRSYLFFAVHLKKGEYARGALAQMTREINRLFAIPSFVVFQHGQALTFAVIDRRHSKTQPERDVLEKVTLIKDINIRNPHRAHIDILADLSTAKLASQHAFDNIMQFHAAWRKTLDISELNKRFFQKIAKWYAWAVDTARFPYKDAGEGNEPQESDSLNRMGVIRLITRLMFIWFLKEKRLVPEELFDDKKMSKLIDDKKTALFDGKVIRESSSYYKAILQNLFFATLNQEMNAPEKKRKNRKFRGKMQHQTVHSFYRYRNYFKDPDAALRLFESIPFLNGGLFECLDKMNPKKPTDPKSAERRDWFSDRKENPLHVPNKLFFDKNRGLFPLLKRHKFTVAENTPIEEEMALDPELLGRVFENLLAEYNPETGGPARKLTGSFYTPREVVNYMVDESLAAYLKESVGDETRLRKLIAYNDEPHSFTDDETERLIEAIDELKIIDPACGSGAFPMGVLHKLVYLLGKLDPRNERWKQRQIARVDEAVKTAERIDDSEFRDNAVKELENEKKNINEAFERNELDYGRKLYLIENCIHGADIQPIAAQIAKLRFFISLIIEQTTDDKLPNRGIRPLPNLETKFIAANALLNIEETEQGTLRSPGIAKKEERLKSVRSKHFTARTPKTKEKHRKQDKKLRGEILEMMMEEHKLPSETAEKMAQWDPYDQNAAADFFDPEWMFGVEQFDILIGNPPYVRQEKIDKKLKPLLLKRFDCFTGRSDLYICFYERGFQLLKEGGVHTFICSNSWLNVQYGAPLQEYLLKNTARGAVCHSEAEREFETADINTIVSVYQKGTPDAASRMRFAAFKGVVGGAETENPRERTPSYEQLKQEGTRNGKYAGGKWGGRYLRAPDIYWTILEKGRGKLKRLGDIADVRIGILTGANDFFFLDEAQVRKWGVEPEFLKPAVKNARDCKSLLIEPNRLKFKVFMCRQEKEALAGTAALEYIEWGESQGFHERVSCRARPRWYDLGERRQSNLAFSYMVSSTARILHAPAGCYTSNNFYGMQGDLSLTLPLCASLNSSLFQLMVNVEGAFQFRRRAVEDRGLRDVVAALRGSQGR